MKLRTRRIQKLMAHPRVRTCAVRINLDIHVYGSLSTLPCGTPDVIAASSDHSPSTTTSWEVFQPVQAWALHAIVLVQELFEEMLVWDYIKSFAEVHGG